MGHRHREFCARDPFGVKPLLSPPGSGTAVVQWKKCLLDLVELVGFDTGNPSGVAALHRLQYVPEPGHCTVVRRLESGCFMRIVPTSSRGDHPLFRCRGAASPITNGDQARYDEGHGSA